MAKTLCSITGCNRPLVDRERGVCLMHYKRIRKYGSVDLPKRTDPAIERCSVCDRLVGEHGARGLCSRHYQSWKRYGDPLQSERNTTERTSRAKRRRRHYRATAESVIGRTLQPGEIVHHIDLDATNNAPNNLYVCRDAAEHGHIHASLERAASEFIKQGLLVLENGEYRSTIRQRTLSPTWQRYSCTNCTMDSK